MPWHRPEHNSGEDAGSGHQDQGDCSRDVDARVEGGARGRRHCLRKGSGEHPGQLHRACEGFAGLAGGRGRDEPGHPVGEPEVALVRGRQDGAEDRRAQQGPHLIAGLGNGGGGARLVRGRRAQDQVVGDCLGGTHPQAENQEGGQEQRGPVAVVAEGHHEIARRAQQQAAGHHEAGPDLAHQRDHQQARHDCGDEGRDHGDTGGRGGLALQQLQVLGQEQNETVEGEQRQHVGNDGRAEDPVAKEAHIEHRRRAWPSFACRARAR